MGFAESAKNLMLDALDVDRVRLHSGDPGAAGADNQLGTLQAASFAAASGGERALSADVDFTGVASNQAVTYVSFWAATGPTYRGSAALAGDQTANFAGEYTLKAGTKLRLTDPA